MVKIGIVDNVIYEMRNTIIECQEERVPDTRSMIVKVATND